MLAHGGADALGVPLHDFSTNANAVGPCPDALAAVQQADPSAYPDPLYTSLRQRLAAFHGVAPERVLCMASASEAMARITAVAVRLGVQQVWMPPAHYADVGRATAAWHLTKAEHPAQAGLVWACEPSTPQGQNQPGLAEVVEHLTTRQVLVWDCAYEPLRLAGHPSLDLSARNRVWQLWSPNKALGLTGVRGAYLLAPEDGTETGQCWAAALQALAPSWPLGVHGVAMLEVWCRPSVQNWLRDSRSRLRDWKTQQLAMLEGLGWECQPSEANYVLARPLWATEEAQATATARWRQAHGVKVRNATSFGWPGWVRLGVRPPASQQALKDAVLKGPTCR